jgi:hypothetical protein
VGVAVVAGRDDVQARRATRPGRSCALKRNVASVDGMEANVSSPRTVTILGRELS